MMNLELFFKENPSVALAFSGGVDSSYLLYEAKKHCARLGVYMAVTPFVPGFERADAQALAKELGVEITILEHDPLAEADVVKNDENRCYHCKRALFSMLTERAKADGFSLVIDGTNASDDAADRPGMRALQELGVRSPLRECGLTKARIRQALREAGLPVWDKPAYACLATRVPTGNRIKREDLERIERGEDALFAMGFRGFRLRATPSGGAKLQFLADQLEHAFEKREAVVAALSPDFKEITLDLRPRAAAAEE